MWELGAAAFIDTSQNCSYSYFCEDRHTVGAQRNHIDICAVLSLVSANTRCFQKRYLPVDACVDCVVAAHKCISEHTQDNVKAYFGCDAQNK